MSHTPMPALVGLTVAEARALGHTIRATSIDGQPMFGTMDWRPGRVNVAVRGGRISAVLSLG